MNNQRRAMFDRAAEIGRGCRIVDNQGDAGSVGDFGDRVEVRDIAARVGDGLAEDGARVVVNRGLHGVEIVKVHEGGRPAEAFEGLAELGDRAAIEARGGDDVAAGGHQREQRHDLGRMTGRTADSARAAFQRGDPVAKGGHGGIGQAGIDIADFLQAEERGGMVCVAEDIGRCLVNRHLTRASGGVRVCARMNLQGVEPHWLAVGHVGSPSLSGVASPVRAGAQLNVSHWRGSPLS